MELLRSLARYIAPPLVAVVTFVLTLDLVEPFGRPGPHRAARLIGSLMAALWLTSLGSKKLLEQGGFLMQLFKVKPSHISVTLFGLVWLGISGLAFWLLSFQTVRDLAIIPYFILGLAFAAMVGGIGVFVFMAVEAQQKPKRPAGRREPGA